MLNMTFTNFGAVGCILEKLRIRFRYNQAVEHPERILIIEDDPAIGQSLKAGLTEHGFAPHLATRGGEGVEYASKASPHLILLDLRLPDGSGFDFCRQMRSLGLRQPIIILTVQRDEVDKVLGLEIGADDYVTKPFSLRELVSRIRAQLRRAYGDYSSPDGSQLFVADLVIDKARGSVTRGDLPLNLTPTEYRLLAYLARSPGQALTRDQIVEEVWGYQGAGDSYRMVNVHIRRLREKIEPDPAKPSILLTVPGIGYRLAG
jgi:DNA-binding response OmpR family regulator